jgi:AraC-like DNA-binding protein
MINDEFWENIVQSVHFELFRSGTGIIEDALWRRSGFSRPYHIIISIERGGFTLKMNYSSETLLLREGDCAYIPAGIWRQNAPFPKSSQAILRFCNFRFHIFDHLDFLSFFQLPIRLNSQVAKSLKDVTQSLDRIYNDVEMDSMIKSIEKQSLGLRLLSSLLQGARMKPHFSKFAGNADRLAKVLDYISRNYHRKVSLDELASIACLSVSAFHRTFKETTGISPLRFLREQRINEARRLLITTDLSLGDIAGKLGFSDPFSFSKCFKKACGQSPREYRQTARKEFGEI